MKAPSAEVDRLTAALAAAEANRAQVYWHGKATIANLCRRKEQLQHQLRETASPLIKAFVAELRGDFMATQKLRDDVNERTIDGNIRTTWTNRDSIEARMEAVSRLISDQFSEGAPIWCAPLDDEALTVRLDEMRASLPGVETRPDQYRRQ